jgi:hypothetical protein
VTLLRVTGSTPKGVRLPLFLEGAAVERVIECRPASRVKRRSARVHQPATAAADRGADRPHRAVDEQEGRKCLPRPCCAPHARSPTSTAAAAPSAAAVPVSRLLPTRRARLGDPALARLCSTGDLSRGWARTRWQRC